MEQQNKMLRFSQELRKNLTKEERHLWYDFLKSYPIQFKRQYCIGIYIVDFYCYKARLIIELDGSQHCEPDTMEYDKYRTQYLENQGYCVLRYSNRDVWENFRGICENIDMCVKHRMEGHL